jgi:hypothetical protein
LSTAGARTGVHANVSDDEVFRAVPDIPNYSLQRWFT